MRPLRHPAEVEITLDGVLHALSDPDRREIVHRLMQSGGMNCSQACQKRPASTVSHHHRILRDAGLIVSEKRGVEVFNSVRRETIDRRFPGLLDVIFKTPSS
ncbi:helix-turn-helix transcriptional regulator [Acidisoma cellulosilytica]|uniref:Helix-turn-helix transcriptional regulator n=1 Tax=Acidisoma cellulosilyticum TaxID=2802395 RepID=A0A963Z8Z3_9PROT|nr:helix-turn-helix transcriptional regulator [Acidisoma cellulosilyticum]